MMEVVLDGRVCKTREELHLYLQKELNLPEYYGKNLDALYDCLSTKRRLKVQMIHCDVLIEALGKYGLLVIQTMSEAAEENPGFELVLEEENEDDVEL